MRDIDRFGLANGQILPFYGDDRPLRDNYDMMKRFVLYHERTNLNPGDTMDHCNYGDWVDTASIGANSRNFATVDGIGVPLQQYSNRRKSGSHLPRSRLPNRHAH